MTLWNAAYQEWLFWDGRADSLWSQALKPFETDAELGADRTSVVRRVASDPELRAAYEAIFGALPSAARLAQLPPRACPLPDRPDDVLAGSAPDETGEGRLDSEGAQNPGHVHTLAARPGLQARRMVEPPDTEVSHLVRLVHPSVGAQNRDHRYQTPE